MAELTSSKNATIDPPDGEAAQRPHRNNYWPYLLVLPPLIGLLYPSFYSTIHPTLAGVPFFIWYQFAWVPVTVAITVIMAKLTD